MIRTDTAVIGGGLAGLSAGYHLKDGFVILEKEREPGGLCRSVHQQGFTFDHAPHILYPADPYTRKLVRKLLAGNLVERKRRAGIYHRAYGTYTEFPFQTHLYGLPPLIIEKCLQQMKTARRHTYATPARTYYQWILRNFGRAMAKEFLVPYSEKLWTVHPRTMNCDWLEGRVVLPAQRDIERGARGDAGRRFGFNTGFWYPRTGGINALPQALAAEPGMNVSCRAETVRISPAAGTVYLKDGRRIACRRMVATVPLPELIPMIDGVPDRVRDAAAALQYNSVTCVNLGIGRPRITPYHWIYYHDAAYLMNRISVPSNMSGETVPAGTSGICAEIAHPAGDIPAKRAAVSTVLRNLKDTGLLERAADVVVKNTLFLPYAYVIYDLRHRRHVDLIHGYLRSQRIIPAGRFGDWEYYNMDKTILSGQRAAREAREAD